MSQSASGDGEGVTRGVGSAFVYRPPERWRVAVVSTRFAVVGCLVSCLKAIGHDPVGWVFPHATIGGRRPAGSGSFVEDRHFGVPIAWASSADDLQRLIRTLEPDLVVYWGCPWKLSMSSLELPRLGSINLHPGSLPRHRGPIPLAWAVRDGDDRFAVTWHRMDADLDTGPILGKAEVPIADDDCTVAEVLPKLIEAARGLLPRVLARVASRDPGDAQRSEGTWAGPFDADYAVVDWNASARSIHDQVRAWRLAEGLTRVPGPIAELNGTSIKLLRTSLVDPRTDAPFVECGEGPLWIIDAEPEAVCGASL